MTGALIADYYGGLLTELVGVRVSSGGIIYDEETGAILYDEETGAIFTA